MPAVFTVLWALLIPTLLIVVTAASWREKVLTAFFGLLIFAGMWWHLRRLQSRPWNIRVTAEGIVGESKSGETTMLKWKEIDTIDLPSKWEIALDGMPRVVLRSTSAGKEFVIGKNIRGYKELAEIIKSHTPHCSHDRL